MSCSRTTSIRLWESLELLFVRIRVKANQNSLASFDSRSSQVASRPQHQANEFIVRRAIFNEVYFGDLPAFGHDEFAHAVQQVEHFVFADAFLARVDLFFCRDVSGRKKLLRAGARCSAVAVVVPVDFLRHGVLSRVWSQRQQLPAQYLINRATIVAVTELLVRIRHQPHANQFITALITFTTAFERSP